MPMYKGHILTSEVVCDEHIVRLQISMETVHTMQERNSFCSIYEDLCAHLRGVCTPLLIVVNCLP